jgi:hypothetical protein
LVFNRPDTTARVFEVVASVRPRKLLVVADGPRPNLPGEAEACAATRRITEKIHWPCEVLRNYADTNRGCARRVATGIEWVFQNVEEAIILEDDCVPDPTFFRFCDEMLERYRDDERVMCISGDNFQGGRRRTDDSYYFSLFTHIWGWATWRRAWRHFDLDMALWPAFRDGGRLNDLLDDEDAVAYWQAIFDQVHRHEIDTWDFSWLFSAWVCGALTILPNVNLVTNIGFDARASHTTTADAALRVAAEAMAFPLRHPHFVVRDSRADRFTQMHHFSPPLESKRSLPRRLLGAVRRWSRPAPTGGT